MRASAGTEERSKQGKRWLWASARHLGVIWVDGLRATIRAAKSPQPLVHWLRPAWTLPHCWRSGGLAGPLGAVTGKQGEIDPQRELDVMANNKIVAALAQRRSRC